MDDGGRQRGNFFTQSKPSKQSDRRFPSLPEEARSQICAFLLITPIAGSSWVSVAWSDFSESWTHGERTNPPADDGKLRSIVVRFMCLLILSLATAQLQNPTIPPAWMAYQVLVFLGSLTKQDTMGGGGDGGRKN